MRPFGGWSTSRLGPTLPTALEALSVWHVEQYLPNTARPLVWAALRSTPPGAFFAWSLPLTTPMASGTATPRARITIVTMTATKRRPAREGVPRRVRAPPRPLKAKKSTLSPRTRNARTKITAAIIGREHTWTAAHHRRRPWAKLMIGGATARKSSAPVPLAGSGASGSAASCAGGPEVCDAAGDGAAGGTGGGGAGGGGGGGAAGRTWAAVAGADAAGDDAAGRTWAAVAGADAAGDDAAGRTWAAVAPPT